MAEAVHSKCICWGFDSLRDYHMKNKNEVLSKMLEKYNASREEHDKVHLWTLALMTAGVISRKSKNRSNFESNKIEDIKKLL